MRKQIVTFLIRRKYGIIFLGLLLTLALIYNYSGIITHRPYSIHQWRQADCLSITKNYYKENTSFFEPAIFWLGEKEGKTVSECPLIYYSVAQLWKVFGFHEFIFRLLNIIIVFTGLYCLFKLIKNILSDNFWAYIITFLLFTSPILVYYTNNFLADAPAFALQLIACLFIWKGFNQENKWFYYLSFIFFVVAGLIKISSLISFFAIFVIHLYIFFFKNEKKWMYKWYSLIPYLIVFFIIYLWYKFALLYNQNNLGGIFLLGIYPIWDVDLITRKAIWHSLINNLVPAYFNKKALYFIFLIYIILLVNFKKTNKVLWFMSFIILFGTAFYILLFFQAFTVHDYYLTNLLVFIIIPLIAFFELLSKHFIKLFNSLPLKIIVSLIVFFLIYKTAVINRMKYSINDWFVENNFIIDKDVVKYWSWFHKDFYNHTKAYETISPYLEKIGVKSNDRVLSLPDESINISLYLMDRKGYSGFGYGELNIEQKMNLYKKHGVHYLVIDTVYLHQQEKLSVYIDKNIGKYENLEIFSLK